MEKMPIYKVVVVVVVLLVVLLVAITAVFVVGFAVTSWFLSPSSTDLRRLLRFVASKWPGRRHLTLL